MDFVENVHYVVDPDFREVRDWDAERDLWEDAGRVVFQELEKRDEMAQNIKRAAPISESVFDCRPVDLEISRVVVSQTLTSRPRCLEASVACAMRIRSGSASLRRTMSRSMRTTRTRTPSLSIPPIVLLASSACRD